MHNTSPKNLSSAVVETTINELYGIKSTKQPPVFISEGVENAAWLFYTEHGNYVLKIFSASETIEKDVHEEVLLYEYLLDQSINTPKVVSSLDSKKISFIQRGRFPIVLMELEDLKKISASDLSKDQIEKIATTVSHMHQVLMNYPRKDRVRVTEHDAMSIYNHTLEDFDTFLTSPNATSPHLQDHERLKRIRMDAIRYLHRSKLEKDLTQTVLHNDLGLGHIQFLPNGEIYIFDFSDFEYGPVALDLGVPFFNFYREGNLTINQWRAMTKDFLAIYSNEIPLTQNDEKAIDIYTVSRLLEHIRYLDNMSVKEGTPVDDEGIKKRYDLLEQLYLN